MVRFLTSLKSRVAILDALPILFVMGNPDVSISFFLYNGIFPRIRIHASLMDSGNGLVRSPVCLFFILIPHHHISTLKLLDVRVKEIIAD